jgi:hypothetical protein
LVKKETAGDGLVKRGWTAAERGRLLTEPMPAAVQCDEIRTVDRRFCDRDFRGKCPTDLYLLKARPSDSILIRILLARSRIAAFKWCWVIG